VPTRVRPEYGPDLPAILNRRFGVPERTSVRVALGALVLAALVGLVVLVTHDGPRQVVTDADPKFNVLVERPVREVRPHAGEMLRLEARRRGDELALTARRLDLPPYEGHVPGGLLPLVAEERIAGLRSSAGDFRLRDEGKARLNNAPGYQIGYVTGHGRERTKWRDTFLVPEDGPFAQGVLLSYSQRYRGRPFKPARKAMREAIQSFSFGTEAAS
jgi:hypothetical protein